MNNDDLLKQLIEIKLELSKNGAQLEEHMRRTQINEDGLVILKETMERLDNNFSNHLAFLKGATWVVGIIITGLVTAKELGLF